MCVRVKLELAASCSSELIMQEDEEYNTTLNKGSALCSEVLPQKRTLTHTLTLTLTEAQSPDTNVYSERKC